MGWGLGGKVVVVCVKAKMVGWGLGGKVVVCVKAKMVALFLERGMAVMNNNCFG